MSSSTTRLALIKPDNTDVVDIAQINANMDRIDASIGFFVCTFATRPAGAAVFIGMPIHQTDTNTRFVWDGSAWRGPF